MTKGRVQNSERKERVGPKPRETREQKKKKMTG